MSTFFKTVFSGVAGAGAVGAVDFLLVEGLGSAGVGYDLLNGGYLADYFKTGEVKELLDVHELNPAEVTSIVAILVSFSLLLFSLSTFRRGRPARVKPDTNPVGAG